MKRNREQKKLIVASIVAGFVLSGELSFGDPSTLTNRGQEKNNWCWNGCSEMILDWSGNNQSQTIIGDWAVSGANVGNYLDTGRAGLGPIRIPFTNVVFFQRGVKQVLENFGEIKSDVFNRSLTLSESQDVLDSGKPFIVREDWSGGGAHVAVVRDYAGSIFSVEDPWPLDSAPAPGKAGISATVAHQDLLVAGYSNAVFGVTGGNRWTRTLVAGRSLDLVFLIDSTGSMGSYIDDAKSEANQLLNDLKEDFDDLRVAVVEFRDYPEYPYGESSDFITQVRTAFTDDIASAVSGINSISVAGGSDFPEAVYSAVYNVANGDGIGDWREGDFVERQIVILGDAPGHSPEPWSGGKSFSDCKAILNLKDITVQGAPVGGNTEAISDYSGLSSASGGAAVTSLFASEVSDVIAAIFDNIDHGRFPVDETANGYPEFLFPVFGGSLASAPPFSKVKIEVQKEHPKKGWRNFRKFTLGDPKATNFVSNKLFKQAEYRWKLAGSTPKKARFELPDGTRLRSDKLGKVVEGEYVEFTRIANEPGVVTKYTPTSVYSRYSDFEVFFEDEGNSSVFAIQVHFENGKSKTYKVKRNKLNGEGTGVLSARIKVKPEQYFSWYVQGLNYDRKKPDPYSWN